MLLNPNAWKPNHSDINHTYCGIKFIGTTEITLPEEPVINPINCSLCQQPLKDPVTLSCGTSLCSSCIPTTAFQCPSFTCLRVHEVPKKHIDITLRNILNADSSTQPMLHCSICLQEFQEPITTECGHTFCKVCLVQSLTYHHCPICRSPMERIGKVNQILDRLIQKEEQVMSNHVPVIEITGTIPLRQDCLFRIKGQSIFKDMTRYPHQSHYVICISNQTHILLKIKHLEHVTDLCLSVIQAHSLCILNQ